MQTLDNSIIDRYESIGETVPTSGICSPPAKKPGAVNLSACQRCGSLNLEIADGKGPHFAALQCKDCGRHVKWLSKRQTKALEGKTQSARQECLRSPAHNQLDLLSGGEA